MEFISVDVRLYGELSCYGKVTHHSGNYSTIHVRLPMKSTLKDLVDYLLMCTTERGFTFINEKMSAVPTVQPDLDYQLRDGDQIIFFPLKMMPTDLHFDVRFMTDKMTQTMRTGEEPNFYYLYE